MCIGCRRPAPVTELVRILRAEDGDLILGSGPGRGAWLCAGSLRCVDQAEKKAAFARALRGPVSPSAIVALRAEVVERARIEG